jgi:hypothetical protein
VDSKDNLENELRRAKLRWRKIVQSPESTPAEKRRALVDWKKAVATRDLALVMLRRARAERRQSMIDRRNANTDTEWAKKNADRRTKARRP